MKKIRKIMIIDDDAVTAYLHKRLLENLQVALEVDFITNPYHGLTYIHQHYALPRQEPADPELIFLDINMPGMDGFELLDALESLGVDSSQVYIVMLTTSPHRKDKEKAAEFGDKLKGYMIKPLQKETVEELLTAFNSHTAVG